jgi:hypothetical protein
MVQLTSQTLRFRQGFLGLNRQFVVSHGLLRFSFMSH